MLFFSLFIEMTLYLFFCLQKTVLSACFPRQPGAARPHASSHRMRAPCLLTAGFISVTVTPVFGNFSPAASTPHLPHLCVCAALSSPAVIHQHSLLTVCWLSSSSLAFFTFSALQGKKRGWSHQTSPWYRGCITAGTSNWGN